MKKIFLSFTLIILCFFCATCTNSNSITNNQTAVSNNINTDEGKARLEPSYGYYFGVVNGNLSEDTINDYNSWLGFTPASYVTFVNFPLNQEDTDTLNGFIEEIAPTGGIAVITLEPMEGLDAVNEKDCQDFADLCAKYENQGLGIMVRFAHEMNGSWYPWGQKPTLYKEKFRLLAQYIHESTQNTAMLWAPNTGGGYPFSGGQYEAKPGSSEYSVLDTNKDNKLDMNDDMYTPYYPGDDAVDWVGMSVYHWGNCYPWFENELPEARSFSDFITGDYNGLNGDQRAVPDFYTMFCNDGVHNKPMAITETAAFNNTETEGESELAIKQAWWNQTYNISGDTDQALDISIHFPKIKMINWFDIEKNESEAKNNLIDWRISGNSIIRAAFTHDLKLVINNNKYVLSAKDVCN
ncbi:MAG: glycosyl hydrolase [Eubacteriales bacterium]|nr:glycosyl hydrolase [Eubacteriales bacterium]